MKRVLIHICIVVFAFKPTKSQVIDFTQEDRDRILRTEIRLEEFQKQTEIQFEAIQRQFEAIDRRFDSVQKQFDSVDNQFVSIQHQLNNQQTFLYWAFGIVISFMGFMFGFMLWDRRHILSAVATKTDRQTDDQKKN